jgi:hypothetical protein
VNCGLGRSLYARDVDGMLVLAETESVFVDMSGSTADVARRGADGWKFVVDNPFGTS